MVARILKRILNVQQIKKSRLQLSSRKLSDKGNPGEERLQTDDLLLIDVTSESDVSAKAMRNDSTDSLKYEATTSLPLTQNTRDSFNDEVKTHQPVLSKAHDQDGNMYSESDIEEAQVKEDIGKAISITSSSELPLVDDSLKNPNKKPINDFIPTFVDPTFDRKLNIGRKDKKYDWTKKKKTQASSRGDDKSTMKMAALMDYSMQLADTKVVPRHGSSIPKIGDIPDLLSTAKSRDSMDRNFGFSTMESVMSAKHIQRHSHKLDIRKVDETEQESKFKINPLDPVSPLFPGYQPMPTDKQLPLTIPAKQLDHAIAKSTSYDAVPGPAVLKTVGNLWSYVPMIGTQFVATFLYTMQSIMSSIDRRFKYTSAYPYYYLFNKYGPMVRLNSPLGADILILAVNGQEYPLIHTKTIDNEIQSLFDSLNTYRRDAPPLLSSVSLPDIGKSEIPGNPTVTVNQYYSSIEKITDQFIRRGGSFIIGYTGESEEKNHEKDLLKWALQCTMEVYFKNDWELMENISDSNLFETFQKVSKSLRLSETGIQLWRMFNTFTWLDLVENCKSLDRYLAEVVTNCMTGISAGKSKGSVLEALLLTEELNPSDMLTPLLDLLVINVYVVASTCGFVLHNLAKNPQVQRNVFREICSVMPKGGGHVPQADLAKLKYLNACIVETLRMSPPLPVLSRELTEDTQIHGVQIPCGTYIQMVNVLPCSRGNYGGDDAGRFQAERWMEEGLSDGDALIGLPQWNSFPNFNKDLVMSQIALLITKIVREYRIDYPSNDVYSDGMVLAGPTSPFNFSFLERII